jgi:hypothetical protein
MACSNRSITSLSHTPEHAPAPAPPLGNLSVLAWSSGMTRVRLAFVVAVLVLSSSFAFAQSSYPPPVGDVPAPPCVPYNNLSIPVCPPGAQPPCSLADRWCLYFPHTSSTSIEEYGDFPNVFIGVPGMEWAFVNLKNKASVASTVVVEVTIAGQPPIYQSYPLAPNDRTDVNLNTWPELANHKGGVSVIVRADQRTGVSVAMHPKITDPNSIAQMTTFWQQSKILQGK